MNRIRVQSVFGAGIAAAVVLPAPSFAQPEPTANVAQYCVATALTAAEVDAGATVEITCSPQPSLALRRADVLMATHHSGLNGAGMTLSISGPADCTGSVVFTVSDPWNDRIRSTVPRACGTAKHYVHNNFTGDTEIASGAYSTTNLTTLDRRTSAIQYGV